MIVHSFVCDSVVLAENRLYVQGAGWYFAAPGPAPFTLSSVGVGVLLHLDEPEMLRPHQFDLTLLGPSGDRCRLYFPDTSAPSSSDDPTVETTGYSVSGPIDTTRASTAPDEYGVVLFALNFRDVVLEARGTYEFVIKVDDSVMTTVPIGTLH